jgi:hypothetical protein
MLGNYRAAAQLVAFEVALSSTEFNMNITMQLLQLFIDIL